MAWMCPGLRVPSWNLPSPTSASSGRSVARLASSFGRPDEARSPRPRSAGQHGAAGLLAVRLSDRVGRGSRGFPAPRLGSDLSAEAVS